jgi:hypothetical protein
MQRRYYADTRPPHLLASSCCNSFDRYSGFLTHDVDFYAQRHFGRLRGHLRRAARKSVERYLHLGDLEFRKDLVATDSRRRNCRHDCCDFDRKHTGTDRELDSYVRITVWARSRFAVNRFVATPQLKILATTM